MHYRRSNLGGGTSFFTVNLAERSQGLLVDHIGALREAIGRVKRRHAFHIDAMVVLPDHLHAVWTLPPGDADYPTRWMLIKAGFSRRLPKGERINASRRSKGERGIWQRRYWEHAIRDEDDFRRHVDYIQPGQARPRRASRRLDPSSLHRYIRDGILPPDWGAAVDPTDGGNFGE